MGDICMVGIYPHNGMKLLEASVPFRSPNGAFCRVRIALKGRAELDEFLLFTGLDATCRVSGDRMLGGMNVYVMDVGTPTDLGARIEDHLKRKPFSCDVLVTSKNVEASEIVRRARLFRGRN
jgi:hypothetical protein